MGRKTLLLILITVLLTWSVFQWWVEHNSHCIGEPHGPRSVRADCIKLRCGDIVFFRSGYRKNWMNFSYIDHVGIVIDDDETIADFMGEDGLNTEKKIHTIRSISRKATILVRQVKRELTDSEKANLRAYVEDCRSHSFDSGFIFLWLLNAFRIRMFNNPRKQNCTSFVYGAVCSTTPAFYRYRREPKSVHISEYSSRFPLLSPDLYGEEIELDHKEIPRLFCG